MILATFSVGRQHCVICPRCTTAENVCADNVQQLIERLSLRGWVFDHTTDQHQFRIFACWACNFVEKWYRAKEEGRFNVESTSR